MRARRVAKLVAAVAAIVLGTSAAAWASSLTVSSKPIASASIPVTITTATFTAVADSFTQQASPSTNSGTSTTMNVASASGANRRSFVRFDLATIPSTARVEQATLQLRMSTAPTASRIYEVDKVNAAWSETGLTWANMPAASAATATVASGTSSNVNLTWTVTTDVASFVASAASNFGWQVKDTVESSATARTATFRTREFGTAAQRPRLTVVYVT